MIKRPFGAILTPERCESGGHAANAIATMFRWWYCPINSLLFDFRRFRSYRRLLNRLPARQPRWSSAASRMAAIFRSSPAGIGQDNLRLNDSFRHLIYAIFALLTLTGAGWLAADWTKEFPGDDIRQQVAADLLMIHGGLAMPALMLLGALIPMHVLPAWRAGRNRTLGSVLAGCNAALILTAFALYYL